VAVSGPPARDDTAEERRLDGPDHQAVMRGVVEEVADVLMFRGCHRPCRYTPADMHQEEDLPDVRTAPGCVGGDVGELERVRAHHRCVDLNSQAGADERADGADRRVEMAIDAAHAVVRGGIRAVEADRYRPDAAARDTVDHAAGEQRGHQRGQANRHTQRDRVPDQVEQVQPEQAVTAGEDEDRVGAPESGDLLDEVGR
jgi:hypothetical protein